MAPPATKKKKATLYFRGIPKPLKLKFKAWCAERGLDMQDAFIMFMESVMMMSRCEWCDGFGEKSHPSDPGTPQGKCSMCEGTGFACIKSGRIL